MTPEEIDTVLGAWRTLAPRRRQLLDAVAANLPASDSWPPLERAAWILEAVDRCSTCLGQPSCLGDDAAAAMVARRRVRDAAALGEEGEALLLGLELSGSLSAEAKLAWRRAWHLLAEMVATVMLAPFGPIDRPASGSPT